METHPLFTIGHGRRKADQFLSLLQRYDIRYLVDVRSVPFSRFNPQYNQNTLKNFLAKNNITYIFMGDTLGGRPSDPDCYNSKGNIDYKKVQSKDFFREGINALKALHEQNAITAIMCSESKPSECHRTKLISTFIQDQIPLQHIDEKGELKTHAAIMKRVLTTNTDSDLFSNSFPDEEL